MVVFPAEVSPTDVPINTGPGPSVDQAPEDATEHRSLKDVVTEITRASPITMLGLAFVAGAVWHKLRR